MEPDARVSRSKTSTLAAPRRASWYAILMPMIPPPMITTSARFTLLSPYHGDGESIRIVIVHSKVERGQAWVTGDASVIFNDASRAFIQRVAEAPTSANAIIGYNNAARLSQAQCPLEVLGIRLLIGIDEDKIERCFALQLGQQVKSFADSNLCPVAYPSFGEGTAHYFSMSRVDFQRDKATS